MSSYPAGDVKISAEFYESLFEIAERLNRGLTLDEVLNYAYDSLKAFIPYDRIGCALLEDGDRAVRAVWIRSEAGDLIIPKDYSASVEGSGLAEILRTAQPRILNDLEQYAKEHPESDSTKRIVREGMRSSLTCPLIAQGKPFGFIFFSSMQSQTYRQAHVETFMRIAGLLATTAEKSRLYERLTELNELKNRFIGIAAHDLRTPLATMAGYLDLYFEGLLGALTEHQKEAIHVMQRSCDNMLALVNHLLDVSVIESGRLELEKTVVELERFLKDCCEANAILARAKSIDLQLELESDLPAIEADPMRLSQVFSNLLSNAVKFSKQNTTIRVKAKRENTGRVVISVEDEGQGIAQTDLPTLFTAFGKTATRPTAHERSAGLGLAIARSLVEAHDGRIWAESQVGRGSVFFVSLAAVKQ